MLENGWHLVPYPNSGVCSPACARDGGWWPASNGTTIARNEMQVDLFYAFQGEKR